MKALVHTHRTDHNDFHPPGNQGFQFRVSDGTTAVLLEGLLRYPRVHLCLAQTRPTSKIGTLFEPPGENARSAMSLTTTARETPSYTPPDVSRLRAYTPAGFAMSCARRRMILLILRCRMPAGVRSCGKGRRRRRIHLWAASACAMERIVC